MSKTICRNVEPGIDDKIAEILGIHEKVVSRIRANYEEEHSDNPLDTSNLEVAARILLNYMHKEKAEKELGFKAVKTIDDMCADTWRWQEGNKNGYK